MAEGFAGARSLDERRRRRIASETHAPLAPDHAASPDFNQQQPTSHQPQSQFEQRFDSRTDFPISRLISHRIWKLIATVVVAIGSTVGLVAFALSEPIREAALGDHFSRIFRLPNGEAFTWFSSFSLLAAAQLAFIIGWVRSRNPRDFGGHYRIWRWAAAVLFVGSVFVATGFHHALADVITHKFKADYPHRHTLNWLVPLAVICLPIAMKVLYDMSNCNVSMGLLGMSLTVAAILAVTPVVDRWQANATMLAVGNVCICSGIFCSLLIHCWYVVHVSSEAPGQHAVAQQTQMTQMTASADRSEQLHPANPMILPQPAQQPIEYQREADVPAATSRTHTTSANAIDDDFGVWNRADELLNQTDLEVEYVPPAPTPRPQPAAAEASDENFGVWDQSHALPNQSDPKSTATPPATEPTPTAPTSQQLVQPPVAPQPPAPPAQPGKIGRVDAAHSPANEATRRKSKRRNKKRSGRR